MPLFGTAPSSGETLIQTASTALSVEAGSSQASTLTATGGELPYVWTLVAGSLPAGYTLDSSGGITGNETSTQVSTFTAQVEDNAGSTVTEQYRFEVLSSVEAALVFTGSTDLSSGSTFSTYSHTLESTGGVPPYTYSTSAGTDMPSGLIVNSAGEISGTPTDPGTSTLSFQVMDNVGSTVSEQFRIAISSVIDLQIDSSTQLESGSTGSAYTKQLTSTGGISPITFSTAANTDLPGGLSVDSAGLITGTPTSTGTSTFTIQVTDSTGSTASQAFSHTISSLSSNVHAYYEDLSTRSETLWSYSLRDNSTLLAMSQGGGSAGSVTYGFSTDAAFHHPQDAARVIVFKGQGDVAQQVRCPLWSTQHETGNTFITWDFFWSSLWQTERFSSLGEQELRAHKFFWLEAAPNGNWGSNKIEFVKTVTNYEGSVLPQIAQVHFAVKFTETGDNVITPEPLEPQLSTYSLKENKWTRFFWFLDMNPGSTNDLMSIWIADEDRDPMKLIDELEIEMKYNSTISSGMRHFNLRIDTSQFRSTHGADMVGYWRNIVMMHDIEDPLPFLQRPLGHSTGSS